MLLCPVDWGKSNLSDLVDRHEYDLHISGVKLVFFEVCLINEYYYGRGETFQQIKQTDYLDLKRLLIFRYSSKHLVVEFWVKLTYTRHFRQRNLTSFWITFRISHKYLIIWTIKKCKKKENAFYSLFSTTWIINILLQGFPNSLFVKHLN